MATVEKISVSLPPEMLALVHQAVSTGEYSSSSEVIREALRAWKHERTLRQQALEELRSAIREGINSGPVENFNVEELIARAKTLRRAEKAQ